MGLSGQKQVALTQPEKDMFASGGRMWRKSVSFLFSLWAIQIIRDILGACRDSVTNSPKGEGGG